MKWQAEMELACTAACGAGDLLLASFNEEAGVQSCVGKDIKTRADFEAEALILRQLASSSLPVLAEESASAEVATDGLHWLVDPLDGTMNFTRKFPMHAVSIALWDGMQPVLGAIYDVSRRTLFSGAVGSGAWRDGQPIRVSTTREQTQAILATGFPTGRNYDRESLASFLQRVQSFKKIRMIGSAALSLAMVAQGTFDAYFEEDIMIWDVAAGLALVAAAGGRIEATPGRMRNSMVVKASNGSVEV